MTKLSPGPTSKLSPATVNANRRFDIGRLHVRVAVKLAFRALGLEPEGNDHQLGTVAEHLPGNARIGLDGGKMS
jgi:hypothetical protein